MVKKRNKKGQVSLWVIISVVLVAAVLLFFFLEQGPIGVAEAKFGPEQYIQKCVAPSIEEIVGKILPQGGFLNPKSFKVYNKTNVAYLCKTEGYYSRCVNIHPMLINEIRGEIKEFISPVIEGCFKSMREELEKERQIVKNQTTNFSVSLAPGKVLVEIDKEIEITEKETTRTFEEFDVEIANPIYELATLAMNIADHERKYCYFEYVGYMAVDRDVEISKFAMSDSTKIYTLKDRKFGKIMNIAIRGCAIPPGGL